ncbi:hypothetical protein Tco_1509437 [Tanacetum coccineum]
MNQEQIRQVTTHDEKWVPAKERVKITIINVRLETTVPQKEETFQVIIDVIKNSTATRHLPSAWLMLKCSEILDICPRVQGVDYAEVPDDKNTLTFLIDLGYKGLLYKHPSMYVDHMHQPWRTLAAIINQCFSGKTTSNDKLRKSRIDILWGLITRTSQSRQHVNTSLIHIETLCSARVDHLPMLFDDGQDGISIVNSEYKRVSFERNSNGLVMDVHCITGSIDVVFNVQQSTFVNSPAYVI